MITSSTKWSFYMVKSLCYHKSNNVCGAYGPFVWNRCLELLQMYGIGVSSGGRSVLRPGGMDNAPIYISLC